jgi:hypothetical protein
MNIISQIVDRLPVTAGKLAVIRYVISRMKDGYKTFRGLPKASRRDIIKRALGQHRDNQVLYSYVMGGKRK